MRIFKAAGVIACVGNCRPPSNKIGEGISSNESFSDSFQLCWKWSTNSTGGFTSTLVLASLCPPCDSRGTGRMQRPPQTEWMEWPPVSSVHLWAQVSEGQTSSYMRESDEFWKRKWPFKALPFSSFGGNASASICGNGLSVQLWTIQLCRAAADWDTAFSSTSCTQPVASEHYRSMSWRVHG